MGIRLNTPTVALIGPRWMYTMRGTRCHCDNCGSLWELRVISFDSIGGLIAADDIFLCADCAPPVCMVRGHGVDWGYRRGH